MLTAQAAAARIMSCSRRRCNILKRNCAGRTDQDAGGAPDASRGGELKRRGESLAEAALDEANGMCAYQFIAGADAKAAQHAIVCGKGPADL